jgi:hypothetical protein
MIFLNPFARECQGGMRGAYCGFVCSVTILQTSEEEKNAYNLLVSLVKTNLVVTGLDYDFPGNTAPFRAHVACVLSRRISCALIYTEHRWGARRQHAESKEFQVRARVDGEPSCGLLWR